MKKMILVACIVTAFLSCKSEEDTSITIGDFNFSAAEITQNEPFTITYNGTADLENSFYSNLKHTRTLPEDLEFVDNKATITIPDSISSVVFNFYVDDTYETNDKKGFLFKVKDKDGNLVSDSDASLKFYLATTGEQYELKGDPNSALQAINEAVKNNPDLTEDWYRSHIYMASKVDSDQAKEIGNNYLSQYMAKEKMELKDYETLSNIYGAMRNRAKSDSIVAIATEKFPESDLALRSKIDGFFQAKDLASKEKIFNADKDRFLKSNYSNFLVRSLAMEHKKNGNAEAFESYVALMEKNTDKAALFNSIAWPNAEKGTDLEASAALSMKSLQLIEEEQKALKEKPDYYTSKQYEKSLVSSYNMYSDTYALLAFKKGDIKEAVKYQAIAVSKNSNPEMNERYVQFLLADKQYAKAKESAAKSIEEGSSTAKLKEYFREAFLKSGADGDAEALLADLQVKAKKKELDELRETLIDEEATDFTLTNLDGEEITLSSLKGKTVVLDFWATWCGPCIASFPGMQQVVTKYKDDDSVAFFFVDTFEDGDDRLDKVSKFIKDNKYDFNVLIDPVKENGNDHQVATDYSISGIPTKIIIGPSGKVKFKSVGYSGSAEKIVSEIDAMVELLKSNP